MTGTLTNLLKEHERALVQTAFLSDAANRIYLQGYNSDDMNVIRTSVDYISNDFQKHCENEERKVYPGLKDFITGVELEVFMDEHKKIIRSLELIKHLIPRENEIPCSWESVLELKKRSREFALLFSGHIQRENDCLFLVAKQILPQKTITQIFKNWKQK
ncbi:MAG TPA: hemerythrin domain-containing protein [Ignavibacteriales bacterium]|nr:hemerythrin domain-containing protein [Ignavibacteriales bacterium]